MASAHTGESGGAPVRLDPKPLTPEAVAPFGDLLQARQDGFESLLQQPDAPGWQLAINRCVDRQATTIHRHFNTRECFLPLAGPASATPPVIVLAPPEDREAVVAFRLTAPVCLHKRVWHTTFAPDGDAEVFICESAHVEGELIHLDHPYAL